MKNTYLNLIEQSFKFPQEGFDLSNGFLTFHGVSLQKLIQKHGSLESYLDSMEWITKLACIQAKPKYATFVLDQFQYKAAQDMFLDGSPQTLYDSTSVDKRVKYDR